MEYQNELMNRNVFIPPSQYETCFVSSAHTNEDIQFTLEAMNTALDKIK